MDKQQTVMVFNTDMKCFKCSKYIASNKHMKIKGKNYHMTCGMNTVFLK